MDIYSQYMYFPTSFMTKFGAVIWSVHEVADTIGCVGKLPPNTSKHVEEVKKRFN